MRSATAEIHFLADICRDTMVQISPADQNPDMKDSHHFLDSDPNFIKNVKTKSKVAKLNKIGKNIPVNFINCNFRPILFMFKI